MPLHALHKELLEQEAHRLYGLLGSVTRDDGGKWTYEHCLQIAPYTYSINQLKKEQNAVILAHCYTIAPLALGVADFCADSYALSLKAQEVNAEKIIFAGVWFMAETAKILNPAKEVIIPAGKAGCSLADAITAQEIIRLKEKYPAVPVLCYINSSADVKAQCDICVTSANVFDIAQQLPQKELIFVPDLLMAQNLENELARRGVVKKIISAGGSCYVHKQYLPQQVTDLRRQYPGIEVLCHPECSAQVCALCDYVGGTQGMQNYVAQSKAQTFALLTEFGFVNRLEAFYPNKTFIWPFGVCAYMKQNTLPNTLQALVAPTEEQIVALDKQQMQQAEKCLQNMFRRSR